MSAPTVYFNGQFVSGEDARIGVFDGGWLHGAGLFETMRAEQGRVFRLEAHMERLRRSAAKLLRPIERVELPSRVDVLELLERNRLAEARVRLTVSAGSMVSDGAGAAGWTVCVSAFPLAAPPEQAYQRGAAVVLSSHRVSPSDPVAGHKTTSYLPRLIGLREAQAKQCMEALWFTTRNTLAEGCISNVFLVQGGRLRTPAVDTPVLAGVARAAVLELARKEHVAVEEAELSIDDLLGAEEVFLTNVVMQVMPVARVERHDVGDGRPGAVTRRLRDLLAEQVRKECAGG